MPYLTSRLPTLYPTTPAPPARSMAMLQLSLREPGVLPTEQSKVWGLMKDLDEKRALGERMGVEDNGERGIGRAPGDRLWAPGRVGGGYGIALETSAAERCTKKATGVGSQGLDRSYTSNQIFCGFFF